MARALYRAAVSLPEIRLRALSRIPVRGHGASRRGVLQRGDVHLPRASDALADARPRGDHLSRGRTPVVRRLHHHEVVRRSLAQGGFCHVSRCGHAGGPHAERQCMEDVLPPQQAGGVRRRRHAGHHAGLATARQPRPGEEQLRRNRLQQGARDSQATQLSRGRHGLSRWPAGVPALTCVWQRHLARPPRRRRPRGAPLARCMGRELHHAPRNAHHHTACHGA